MHLVPRSFLDDIIIEHGPAQLIGRFLIAANREMRARGVSLTLRTDLRELIAFNEKNRKHWYRLAPLFDPAFNTIPPGEAYWIAGYDQEGDLVAVHAARFFDWTRTDLATEFASLRLWYDEPERWRMPGETCSIASTAGQLVTGRCAYLGSMWFRPDFRGRGLSTLLPRINRTIALAHWGIDFNFSFIEAFVVGTGLIEQYGFSRYTPGVAFRNGPKGDMDMHVMWMPRDELTADLERWMTEKRPANEKLPVKATESAARR